MKSKKCWLLPGGRGSGPSFRPTSGEKVTFLGRKSDQTPIRSPIRYSAHVLTTPQRRSAFGFPLSAFNLPPGGGPITVLKQQFPLPSGNFTAERIGPRLT